MVEGKTKRWPRRRRRQVVSGERPVRPFGSGELSLELFLDGALADEARQVSGAADRAA